MRSLPLISLVACLAMPTLASAADAGANAPAAPVIKDDDKDPEAPLEVHGNEILVTAPRIIGSIDVPQKPIEVFDENDIASYGVASIEELLDAISPQTGSGRGRGDGRPLMLLNGQRISSFREMRGIPPEAIRRVEVLPEEVALRFGYSANQRVVNIILKDQFAAVTTSGEYNRPTRGGYDNYELEGGLFKISGPRRYNINGKLDNTSMLTEAERGITQEESRTSQVAGDPDPARYRSLAAQDHELTLEGTMTQGLGEKGLAGAITVTGGYTRSNTVSLSGLDTVDLTYDGQTLRRTLPDPLTNRSVTDTFEGGLGYSSMIGEWQFSATANATYTDANTRVDRRRGDDSTADLRAAVASGALDIAGALPDVPGAGVDTARTRQLTLSNLATISGKPFRMPAGEANLTIKAGYDYDRSMSEDTRNTLGNVTLKRGDVLGGVNLALPLTSKGEDFLGAVGDITLNFSGGLDHLSDFGTLKDWSAGVTWSPTDTLMLQASYIVDEAAPKLTQLAAPNIVNYNVAVYDFTRGQTALVTTTTGGNPDLRKETQRDWKISAQWKLPFMQRSNLIVEYFRNRSSDVTQSFPLLTPAIEAAFPNRVTRDAEGNLIAIDRRAVTFDEVKSSSLRWGFNISGSLGGSSSSSGGAGAGSNAGGPSGARMASAPAQSVTGPNGPMAGAQTLGGQPAGAPGAGRQGFDPSRFAAIREKLCAPGAADPDPATLPEGLRNRLSGPDGKLDPTKLAEFKQRACSADGPGAGPGGPGQGGPMDPERFERIRTALCSGGSGPPDVASLPDRMRERIMGADGKVDPAKLEELKQRFCSGNAPTPGAGGERGGNGGGEAQPMFPPPGAFGGPPPMASNSGSGGAGGTRSEAGGRGPGGMGGPPGGGFGPPGGRNGSRWNLSIYHTWRFTDTILIAPGVPVLDQLNGDSTSAGGTPRHSIEAEGGLFKNGYGLRLKAEWEAPARVDGSGAPSSQDLRFGSTFDVSLRVFADLGRNENLVAKMPFFKGARLSLVADNLLDSRQKVTDQTGATPIAYQRAYRQPQGRVLGIDFRKMF
ncbi:TonB-dependent receptor [Novosphingobium kaempferiae]|uniref:TonB-dependent receptor n=1 Tax=Novosphingobium kaempferiae TaxID=2896849 RepID=UPI001E388154|nr:TonB-dependent receptor [Novosphingobium kaempferiae]